MFKKFFYYFILIILLILLFYTFYKSEIVWEGTKRYYYNKIYILNIILLVVSIIYLFLNDKIKNYFLIFFISISFGAYLSEFYLVILKEKLNINKKIKIYKTNTGKQYDLRSPIQFYNDNIKDNIIVPAVTPNIFFRDPNIKKQNFEIVPFSGISNSETFVCNENGYYSVFKSDRYGFNNPDEEWSKNKIEYVLVGDSFTQGSCLNRPYDIASQLRIFSNKSVLNLGYGSTGPLIQHAILREYIKKDVKNIIWLYFEGNDGSDLSYELSSKFLMSYLKDENFKQDLLNKQNRIDQISKNVIKILYERNLDKAHYFNKKNFLKLTKLRALINSYFFSSNQNFFFEKEEFVKIVKLTNNLVKKNNSKLYFVYLPDYKTLEYETKHPNYEIIKKIILDNNIKFIDINDAFKKNSNPLIYFPFKLSGHYNKKGYAKIAKEILNQVEK